MGKTPLRAARDKRRLKAYEVADSVGISASYYSAIENGHKRPTGDLMLAISRRLGVSVEELFGSEPAFTPAPREFVGSELDLRVLTNHEVMGSEMLRASRKIETAFGGPQNNVHVARLQSHSLTSLGYMPGDFVLVDHRDPESAVAGDIVQAQVEHESGEWETILRRLDPPFLMPASPDPRHRAHTLGPQTQLRGIVIASWRVRAPEPELLEVEAAEAG